MPSQTYLTVAEASVRVNKSRQTLFDKIKRGQLSATVNHDGIKVIEVSELLRVFGTLLSDEQMALNQANKAGQATPTALTSTLQLELELTKMQLELANERIQELKERERQHVDDRAKLLTIIDRQTLLLAAPKPARPKTAAAPKGPPPPVVKKPAAKAVARPSAAKKSPEKVPTRSPKPVAKKATRR